MGSICCTAIRSAAVKIVRSYPIRAIHVASNIIAVIRANVGERFSDIVVRFTTNYSIGIMECDVTDKGVDVSGSEMVVSICMVIRKMIDRKQATDLLHKIPSQDGNIFFVL